MTHLPSDPTTPTRACARPRRSGPGRRQMTLAAAPVAMAVALTALSGGTAHATTPEVAPEAVIDLDNHLDNTGGANWVRTDDVYTIKDGADVVITGTAARNARVEVEPDATATITLDDAVIDSRYGDTVESALALGTGADVELLLDGHNSLTVGSSAGGDPNDHAALGVPAGAALTIDDGGRDGDGELNTSSSSGSGIGGGYLGASGDVTITDGRVTARSGSSAGIGGSYLGASGAVTITGGQVTAIGRYGAGIGGGSHRGDGGQVTITGGDVTATSGYGAGIGGGYESDGGEVTITGGTVTAKSQMWAGIGGGFGAAGHGSLTLEGGTVTASGGVYYRAIGVDKVALNAPTLAEGWEFTGWHVSEDGSESDLPHDVAWATFTGSDVRIEAGPTVTAEAWVTASGKGQTKQHMLTIAVTETLSDGTSRQWVSDPIAVSKQSATTYDVGDYQVFVQTKGNIQVSQVDIVQ